MKKRRVFAFALTAAMAVSAVPAMAAEYDGSAPITDQEGATVSVLATNSWYSTVDLNKADVVLKVAENAGVTVDWNMIDPTTYTNKFP